MSIFVLTNLFSIKVLWQPYANGIKKAWQHHTGNFIFKTILTMWGNWGLALTPKYVVDGGIRRVRAI